jgi:hypothetical protein
MAVQPYQFDPEKLGRKRFPDNKAFRAQLNSQSALVLSALQDLLPSNLPKDQNPNLAQLYRILAREAARQNLSMSSINDDKVYSTTRIEYIHQILGERLFFNDQIVPFTTNDVDYRNFLLAIKNALLVGSTKSNIENLINEFTNLKVNLKELYLEARTPGSAYGLTDTHKMLIEVFIDDLASGQSIDTINFDLSFFVNLVKPAHVLYDTKFIWTETLVINKIHDLIYGDTGGGCVPKYIYTPFTENTVLGESIVVVPPSTTGNNIYRIGSIHPEDFIIYTTNDIKVIVEPGTDGTQLYILTSNNTLRRIFFSDLQIGQLIQLVSLPIPGDFNFYFLPPDLVTNYSSRFYRSVFRKPAFQEFVKKQMDVNGRFPLQIGTTPTTLCDRWVEDALQPMYEDLRTNCNFQLEAPKSYTITLAKHMWSPRFSFDNLQAVSTDRDVLGDTYSFTMPYGPLTDGHGNLATPSDFLFYKDGTELFNAVQYVDGSNSVVSLFDSTNYWGLVGVPSLGSIFRFQYYYKTIVLDSTEVDSTGLTDFVFGLAPWQLPNVPVSNGTGSNLLALPSDVRVSVDGTYIPDAVSYIEPVLGQVLLQDTTSFWVSSPLLRTPVIGDQIEFDYYQSGTKTYSILLDDAARELDDEMVFDGATALSDPARTPIPQPIPSTIGYKFRTDLLHHASVLNSPDTLLLNNFQKPAIRASLINRQDSLNHFNYFFSPEFLTDTNPRIVLNDQYLDSSVAPAINLPVGTPPFQKTYAYQPGLVNEDKLQDIRTNHKLLMFSDLLIKESQSGDNVPLSSICDSAAPKIEIGMKEEIEEVSECAPWILFDTADVIDEKVTIPGTVTGNPNLRIPDIHLRDNFILRDTSSTGISVITSDTFYNGTPANTVYQMPEYIKYYIGQDPVDFPALPLMKDISTPADITDITVEINGTVTPGIVTSINPTLGKITLSSVPDGAEVVFIYNIQSTRFAEVMDPAQSRILDDVYVFPDTGTTNLGCFDGFGSTASLNYQEYINYLSDYGNGVKFKYLNKDTCQIEEHVFTGPVFETYNAEEDEISSRYSFPGALVRILSPLKQSDPLQTTDSPYNFLNDPAVRLRHKTLHELLPDRTFRTLKITEAMPV